MNTSYIVYGSKLCAVFFGVFESGKSGPSTVVDPVLLASTLSIERAMHARARAWHALNDHRTCACGKAHMHVINN